MKKIANAFKKNANIAYIIAGYPSLSHTKELLSKYDKSDIDLLEIGIPYSDPIADGKTIEKAGLKALEDGVNTDDVFKLLQSIKVKKPLVFLVYYNLILAYGMREFIAEAKKANISGFIIPDLPIEENKEIFKLLSKYDIALIPLVTISSQKRIQKILKRANGFIYCVGVVGITGGKTISHDKLKELVDEVKKHSNLPTAIGFGVKTNEDIKALRKIADGVIVGTKIVQLCENEPKNTIKQINELFRN